ncbi:MAG: transglutaminase domain-containing protein [Parasporobacterium sp.]|nr:transglutaminase domain-containing protein [Parasporobacterium sp.]
MSNREKEQLNEIYKQRKEFRDRKRRTMRFTGIFACTLILLALCAVVTGALYIIKNSPDRFFVVMRDRKPPVATVHNAVSANGKTYQIEDFVDNVDDITDVSMSFVEAPDYDTDGNQKVVIRFTDEAGNYTDQALNLNVYHDTSAPVIYADDDVYVFWNDAISYKSFVSVEDDYDEECELEIDNSQVDVTKVGDYDVIYTARDSVGNESSKTVHIHVLEPDTDEYYLMKANELCDKILAQITYEGMDDLHKIWAVYFYVRDIPYVLTDYTRNYIREGYKMLNEYRGDCYGSYSAVRLLLDRAGITNIPIQTDETYTRHFWNMVTLDGVNWYHVDATNWTEWGYIPNMCMISDVRLDEISAQHGGTHYHIKSDYPETPYNSMPVPEDISAAYGVYDWS